MTLHERRSVDQSELLAKVLAPPSENERTAKPRDMFIVWGGVNVAVTNLAVGALGIALGLSLVDCLLVYLFGGAIGSLSLAAGVLQGQRTGAPVMVNSRPAFGRVGSHLFAGLLFLMSAGWFGINSFFGFTAASGIADHLGLPKGTGMDAVLLLLIVAVQLAIACYGFELIRRFERVAVAGVTACLLVIIAFAANGHVNWTMPAKVSGIDRFGMMFFLITALGVGWALSWTPWAHDMGRYVRSDASPKATFWWSWAGMWLLSFVTFSTSAAVATKAGAQYDVGQTVSAVLPDGLAVVVLLVMTLGLISANVVPLFSGGLALLSAGIRVDRRIGTVLTALVGLVIPIGGLFQDSFGKTFDGWMLGLLTWIAPWFAILMVDFFVIHRGHYRPAELFPTRSGDWSTGVPALTAWAVGFAASWPFANTPLYASPLMTEHLGGADFSYWVGAIVAVAIYYPWRMALLRRAHTA
jgi:nucleobase:cation symporter-1, NCS1 family